MIDWAELAIAAKHALRAIESAATGRNLPLAIDKSAELMHIGAELRQFFEKESEKGENDAQQAKNSA